MPTPRRSLAPLLALLATLLAGCATVPTVGYRGLPQPVVVDCGAITSPARYQLKFYDADGSPSEIALDVPADCQEGRWRTALGMNRVDVLRLVPFEEGDDDGIEVRVRVVQPEGGEFRIALPAYAHAFAVVTDHNGGWKKVANAYYAHADPSAPGGLVFEKLQHRNKTNIYYQHVKRDRRYVLAVQAAAYATIATPFSVGPQDADHMAWVRLTPDIDVQSEMTLDPAVWEDVLRKLGG
jgi:hypothetical protein